MSKNNVNEPQIVKFEDFQGIVENGEITLNRYSGFESELQIPSCINNFPVTRLAEKLLSGKSNITKIEIPNSVIRIEESIFSYCYDLKTIVLNDNHTIYELIDGVLFEKDTMKLHTYLKVNKNSYYAIPNNITKIADSAFLGCKNLNKIDIPDSMKSIGEYSFWHCVNLTDIIIPNSVTNIGKGAFKCCKGLVNITLPNTIKVIDDFTFWGCEKLKKIVIPDSVSKIGFTAFEKCSNLNEIYLSENLEFIGPGAFVHCTNLNTIKIPNTVNFIGKSALLCSDNYCNILIEKENPTYSYIDGVLFNKKEKKIESYLGFNKQSSYTIPKGIVLIEEESFFRNNYLRSVVIPDTVSIIKSSAFYCCQNLLNITIPHTVTQIERGAFWGNPNLVLQVEPRSIAHQYAYENNFPYEYIPDTSWL